MKRTTVKKNMNFIRKIAWSYYKSTTGVNIEDLISEAVLHYLIAETLYNKKEGDLLKFASRFINNHLTNYCKKEQNYSRRMGEINGSNMFTNNTVSYFELYDSLPEDCKIMASIVTDSPHDFAVLTWGRAQTKIRGQLLRRKWSRSRISRTMQKLRNILDETPKNCIIY